MTTAIITISNSGPLIALAKIGHFELLQKLFGTIIIPQAVFDEVTVAGGGQPGSKETIDANWIAVQAISDEFAVSILEEELGSGESEAIVLAQELKTSWLLLDDALARRKAERLGLTVIGTLGVILVAKRSGILSTIKPLLDELRTTDFRASEKVYQEVLAKANE